MQFSNFSIAFAERTAGLLRTLSTLMIVAALSACSPPAAPDTPPPQAGAMSGDELRQRVTVSGVSAGGFMAVQAHVALADRIGGVASVSGGPYGCANGSISEALGPCMKGEGIDVASMRARVQQAADAGDIAPLDAVGDARVWIFHSPADSVVDPRVSVALADFYSSYVPAEHIRFVDDVEAAHGWPTLASGRPCQDWGGDFINACEYDTAGELLGFLYDGLSGRAPAAVASNLHEVDMSAFFPSGSDVADTGYLYAPSGCAKQDTQCRLHIVLHGCKQGVEFVEDRFISEAGFNEWAETNGIVVVYPQVEKSMFNPNGCWDWWGYTNGDYANRKGPQVAGVAAIIDAFANSTLLGR